jgi:triacylglycerol lipase
MNIILVHGILGSTAKFGIQYFQGVADHFRAKGLRVFVPQLDPTRGVAYRGNQLMDQITAACRNGTLDVNATMHIIAHSLGGLDSRYILSPQNANGLKVPIRSLITISTPHRGAPIADLLESPAPIVAADPLLSTIRDRIKAALNEINISLDALHDLTWEACGNFEKYVNNPNVNYFSVAGSGRQSIPDTSAFFVLSHAYVLSKTGEANDGMVPISSARWGSFDPNTWPADHADEIGHNLDAPFSLPPFSYLARYDLILSKLAGL